MTGNGVVAPTLAGDRAIPIRNIWFLLLYAWNQAALLGRWRSLVESAPDLDSLLASILAEIIRQRLRIGLGRAYQDHTEMLDRIRGRIDFSKSVKRQALLFGRAVCRFQDLSQDVPKNQIVRATLLRLAKVGEFGGGKAGDHLRQELRLLGAALDQISPVLLSPSVFRTQNLGHDENDYRVMLSICEMLMLRQMPADLAGTTAMSVLDRNALMLSRIYESFVANFYRAHLKGWLVHTQARLDWNASAISDYLPSMCADIVLEHCSSGRITVIDTKFTARSLKENRFGKLRFDETHIYQMYAYLRSQEARSREYASATGILLYPTAGRHLSESILLQGHSVQFETVDLSVEWPVIQNRLLSVIHEISATTH